MGPGGGDSKGTPVPLVSPCRPETVNTRNGEVSEGELSHVVVDLPSTQKEQAPGTKGEPEVKGCA